MSNFILKKSVMSEWAISVSKQFFWISKDVHNDTWNLRIFKKPFYFTKESM